MSESEKGMTVEELLKIKEDVDHMMTPSDPHDRLYDCGRDFAVRRKDFEDRMGRFFDSLEVLEKENRVLRHANHGLRSLLGVKMAEERDEKGDDEE